MSLIACSRNKIGYGSVKSDPSFSCNDTQNQVEIYCRLDKICNSKNELEIRLAVEYKPLADFALYVLTKNDNGWTATKYSRDFHHSNNNNSIPITSHKLNVQQDIEKLFDTLKQNDVFSLPDQKDLKVQDYVDDGSWYTLTFKVGEKFRKYEFNNPDIYQEEFGQVVEFKKYLNIANIFYNSFHKK